jgi:hypothetical protein
MAVINKMGALGKQSPIATPTATYGVQAPKAVKRERVIYGGETFPYFLLKNGGNPKAYRRFWRENRVGAVSDVRSGEAFLIPIADRNEFKKHPYAK